MIHTHVSSSRPVSMKAEKFSTLPCPYWWSASAGLSETRTEKNVTIAAMRSSPECAASDKMPRLPVVSPTTIFRVVIAIAASTEFPATARFSARMDSGLSVAASMGMTALSPLLTPSANPVAGTFPHALPTAAELCARISLTFRYRFGGSTKLMMRYGLVCLLLAAMSWGQASSTSAPVAQQSGAPAGAAVNPADSKEAEAAKVAPDAPVITINGLCDNPPADKAADPNCKSVITRAEFEKILDAIQPNMPPRARRQFAMRYSSALVTAHKAHEMGLDQGPKFEDRMKLMRMQVLTQLFNQAVQDKAAQISDKDIEDYYTSKSADFEEADLQRIVVPRSQQLPASKVKLSATAQKKREKDAEEVMQKEADKLRARAVAGEDFAKLQNAAYALAALKAKPPTTKLEKMRRA